MRPGTVEHVSSRKVSISFDPVQLPPALSGTNRSLSVLLRYDAPTDFPSRTVTVKLGTPKGISASPRSQSTIVTPGKSVPVTFVIRYDSDTLTQNRITATADTGDTAIMQIGTSYDLSTLSWRGKQDSANVAGKEGWTHTGFIDSDWPIHTLPFDWNAAGIAYLRTHVNVPEYWRGKDIYLHMRSAESGDAYYLNGSEIVKTGAAPKDYKIEPNTIDYGGDNVICIVLKTTRSVSTISQPGNYLGTDIP